MTVGMQCFCQLLDSEDFVSPAHGIVAVGEQGSQDVRGCLLQAF